MTNNACTLQFITPCFCAGADQTKAEIRAPSLRGQLRWWFRVLGATPEQEKRVFGGVHGGASASAVVLRVSDVRPVSNPDDLRTLASQNTGIGYIFHFAHVSGKERGARGDGPRWQSGAFFSPGTSFRLSCTLRAPLPRECEARLQQAWDAFLLFGTLGLRGTRGCGAWVAEHNAALSAEDVARAVTGLDGFVGTCGAVERDWRAVMEALGTALRSFRQQHGLSGKTESAVGSSAPRHASALHLRPVQVREGILPVALYTDRVKKASLPSLAAKAKHFFT